ncbi:pyroglutamyl-peptidase I [Candidatus Thorarchaeota archaeon]|nr:MAG: pyroglutamyl-peptidase I [Candidatus Thorarchaeota archaeon]
MIYLGVIMPNLLITGFEPFNGFTINPSEEVAKTLEGQRIGNYDIVSVILPLDYKNALNLLDYSLKKHKPRIVLCCGQANRAVITIERIAINSLNTRRADNYGNIPEMDIINEEGPAAYFSNMNPHQLVDILRENEIPAEVSYFAGAFGCNWLLYNLMQRIETEQLDIQATFIHLPPLPTQAIEKDDMNLATMPLELQVEALLTIIDSLD